MLVGRELYFDDLHLRNYLVETCTIMGERFSEYNEWLAEEKAETEENRRGCDRVPGVAPWLPGEVGLNKKRPL
jgi:hypothetical protein